MGDGRTRSAYDYFLAMFPKPQLTRMARLTSSKLEAQGSRPTTRGELLKFFGVIILATRYEFSARADLWATKARNSCLVAPGFGERTGLPRTRVDALWSCVTFSEQKSSGDVNSEQHRWE